MTATWEDQPLPGLEPSPRQREDREGEADALADRIWGPGEWVRCEACPDSLGEPSRHHRRAHDP